MSSVTVSNIGWFSEGGFFWLDIDLWGDYHEIPVVYDEEGLNQGWGCPEEIIVNDVFKFVQYYENDNVYEKYTAGNPSGEFYSLYDIEGNGYYTGLIGSPCMFAVLSLEYDGVPLIFYSAVSVQYYALEVPLTIQVTGLQLPEDLTIATELSASYHDEDYDSVADLVRGANYGSTCTITDVGDDQYFPMKFDTFTYYNDGYITIPWDTEVNTDLVIAGVAIATTNTALYDSLKVKALLGDFTLGGNSVVSIALEDAVADSYTDIQFKGAANQAKTTTYELDTPTKSYGLLGVVGNKVTIQLDGHKTVTHEFPYITSTDKVTITTRGSTIIVDADVYYTSGLKATIYFCSCDPRIVDKTDYISSYAVLLGDFVAPYSVMAPTLRVDYGRIVYSDEVWSGAFHGNYVLIEEATTGSETYPWVSTPAYYYVTDKVCVGANVWDLHLKKDLLMTYKAKINKSIKGYVDRASENFNPALPDPVIGVQAGQGVTSGTIATSSVFKQGVTGDFVLTGILVAPST